MDIENSKINTQTNKIKAYVKQLSKDRNFRAEATVIPKSQDSYLIEIKLNSSKKITTTISKDKLLNIKDSELNDFLDDFLNNADPDEMRPPRIGL